MININKGKYSVAPEYRNILPEAKEITWDDDFFHNDEDAVGIVAVFDFDYDKIISFRTQLGFTRLFFITALPTFYLYLVTYESDPLVFLPIFILVLSTAPCFLQMQVRWEAYAQHLVITRDGIRYVQDKRKSCWGLPMCDQGKNSKTVPFDKITDCDIEEPAGNSFLIVPNVLMVVNIDTASSGTEGKSHELVLAGLQDAYSFKRLVWAMKRAKEAGGGPFAYYQAPLPRQKDMEMEMTERKLENAIQGNNAAIQCSDMDSKEIKGMLRDIRDELHENNQLLRQQVEKKRYPTTSEAEIV